MTKIILSTVIALAFYNCKIMAQDSLTFEGKFTKHQFHNKIGKPIEGIYDVFFHTSDSVEVFVKKIKCEFPEGKLNDNFDKTFIIKAHKNFGLWDADDNTVQSRVGDYIIVYEILKKD